MVSRKLGLGPDQEVLTKTSGPRPRTSGQQHVGHHGLYIIPLVISDTSRIQEDGAHGPWPQVPEHSGQEQGQRLGGQVQGRSPCQAPTSRAMAAGATEKPAHEDTLPQHLGPGA